MLTWLNTVRQMLTLRQWWEFGGMALLLTLLWSIGLWFHWRLVWLLGATVFVLMAAMVVLVVRRVRANRDAAALEHSIRGQAQEALDSVRPERREQLEQIEREFIGAITSLKQSRLGKRGRGKSALYALPWYVVIGPPSAGKTTAIVSSGLDFPFGTNRVSGFGGTRNCDWFFSTSAILLDTSGRYTTVSEDREEWFKFLDLLKKHRRRTPLNGALAMVSIDELLEASPSELEALATDLRARVVELTERLGIRFPVYVVLTKCDKIRGFAQFFGGLTPPEREQVWGCTFSATVSDTAAQFETEFAILGQALVDRRLARLAQVQHNSDDTREVFLFPLEFAAIGATLKQFFSSLFKSDPFHEIPDFRGFYFTSALQEGSATDRVLGPLADRFALAAWNDHGSSQQPSSERSFIKSLLSDLIISDRNRVAPTSGAATARERIRRGAVAGTGVALVAFVWAAGSAFTGSGADLRRMQDAVRSATIGSGLDSLARLESVLDSLDSLGVSRRVSKLGLDRTGQFRTAVESLFVARIVPILRPRVLESIANRLPAYTGTDTALTTRARAHEDLHAYLLLGSDVRRLRVDADGDAMLDERVFLTDYLRSALSEQPRDSVYVRRFVSLLKAPVMATDSQLVTRMRGQLYAPPTIEGLYRAIRMEGARRPPLVLERLIGNATRSPFERGSEVKWMYTKTGWEKFVQGAIEAHSKEPGKRDWVVGSQPEKLDAALADPERVADELVRLYFADYITEWSHFLRGVRYTPGNVSVLMQMLSELSDAERSPLVVLLDSVTAQTRFDNAILANGRQTVTTFIARVLGRLGIAKVDGAAGSGYPVDSAFAQIHALRGREGQVLGQVQQQYATFGKTMEAYADQSNAGTSATLLNAAKLAVVNMPAAIQKLEPAIRAALIERPFVIAQQVIGGAAGESLGRDWAEQVCKPFQRTLADKYPFTTSATNDASFSDVERFFQPQGGTIWAFYDRNLSEFLRDSDFSPRAGSQAAFTVSPEARAAFSQARAVRDGLLGGSGTVQIEFELQPEAPKAHATSGVEPVPTKVCITIDGRPECYQMGSQYQRPFVWPAKAGTPGAKITVTLLDGKRPVELSLDKPGEWGWLRLVDAATVTRQPEGRNRLEWQLGDPGGRFNVSVGYTLISKRTQNLFDDLGVLRRFNCPSRLQ